jgi:hypothetical protein
MEEMEWRLYSSKIPESIKGEPDFRGYLDGSRISVPFMQGESIMISHTLSVCHFLESSQSKHLCPITDNNFHRRSLRYRISKGSLNYTSNSKNEIPESRRAYEVLVIPPSLSLVQVLNLRSEKTSTFKSLELF